MARGPADIIAFWFADSVRKRWLRSTPQFDAEIRTRFVRHRRELVRRCGRFPHSTPEELDHLASKQAFTG